MTMPNHNDEAKGLNGVVFAGCRSNVLFMQLIDKKSNSLYTNKNEKNTSNYAFSRNA